MLDSCGDSGRGERTRFIARKGISGDKRERQVGFLPGNVDPAVTPLKGDVISGLSGEYQLCQN